MHNSITAHACGGVVDSRTAASRIPAKQALADHSIAAHATLARVRLFIAARKLLAVDDRGAAACRVVPVFLVDDHSTATDVGLVVIYFGFTAR